MQVLVKKKIVAEVYATVLSDIQINNLMIVHRLAIVWSLMRKIPVHIVINDSEVCIIYSQEEDCIAGVSDVAWSEVNHTPRSKPCHWNKVTYISIDEVISPYISDSIIHFHQQSTLYCIQNPEKWESSPKT